MAGLGIRVAGEQQFHDFYSQFSDSKKWFLWGKYQRSPHRILAVPETWNHLPAQSKWKALFINLLKVKKSQGSQEHLRKAEREKNHSKTQIENVQQQCLVNTSVQSTGTTAKTDRREDAFDSQRAQMILFESDGSNKLLTRRYAWQPTIHLYQAPSGPDDSGVYPFDTALILTRLSKQVANHKLGGSCWPCSGGPSNKPLRP